MSDQLPWGPAPGTRSQVSVVADAKDKLAAGFVAAQFMKAGIRQSAEDEAIANEFRSWHVADFAREFSPDPRATRGSNADTIRHALAQGLGRPRLRLRGDLSTRALSTSDFPALLANLGNKALAVAYSEANVSYPLWTRKGTVSDFKPHSVVQLSAVSELALVPQGAPITNSPLSDRAESYAVGTYAKIIPLTREALVNDDLGAFVRLAYGAGAAARRTVNKSVYAIINNGATSAWNMSDGVPLFDAATHANYGTTGTALDATTLGAARAQMLKQTGLAGETLSILPRHLLCPPSLEQTALELTFSSARVASGFSSGVANVFQGSLQVAVDAEMEVGSGGSSTAWALAANPNEIDTVEVGFLNGVDAPVLQEEDDFDSFGNRWRVFIDFGVKPIDWRGLVKRTGAGGG